MSRIEETVADYQTSERYATSRSSDRIQNPVFLEDCPPAMRIPNASLLHEIDGTAEEDLELLAKAHQIEKAPVRA